ncbi:MAG TPA: dTDP-4-dehydrorhamnose reductase [Acidobacteriaceae bacterium]|nr:dTDP-4-dehydrorhamnose reductase [Acidobacteriaceae bacterium]
MKIAVIGADGQLGSDICVAFRKNRDEVAALTHSVMELSSAASVTEALAAANPDFIVNTAAMHHVDKCQADPERALQTNAIGARNVAAWAQQAGVPVVYISTDYVFDGKKGSPYVETDAANPLNAYGISKLAAERFTATTADRHFVVRVSAIYGHHPCRAKGGLNFVELMLKLARERGEVRVVGEEFVTPTPTAQIAAQLVVLSRSNSYGLYHATAEGSCSWYEFAREIFDATGTQVRLEKASAAEFQAKVPRPSYSVLENDALKAAQMNVYTHWREGLHTYLGERAQQATAATVAG